MREIATGLQFPEGPIAMADGSIVLVEIKRGTLTRVTARRRDPGHRRARRRTQRRRDRPRRARLRLQQRRLRVARAQRTDAAGQPAGELHRRLDPGGRSVDRQGRGALPPRAATSRSRDRTISSSTRAAASGSPTTARTASAIATAPASSTRAPTARPSSRPSSRSMGPTASASRPRRTASTSSRP